MSIRDWQVIKDGVGPWCNNPSDEGPQCFADKLDLSVQATRSLMKASFLQSAKNGVCFLET